MKNKFTLTGTAVAVLLSSNALALDITSAQSLDLQGTIKENMPIIVSDEGSPIFHLNENGAVNNYIWVNDKNQILGRGPFFVTPSDSAGQQIRLCEITESAENCSNELSVVNTPAMRSVVNTPAMRSVGVALDAAHIWAMEDNITTVGDIFETTTELGISTILKYIEGSVPGDDITADNVPKVNGLYYTLTDGENAISSPVSYADFTEMQVTALETYAEAVPVNLTGASTVELCSIAIANSGVSPYFNSSDCDLRVVQDETIVDGGYIHPPTVAQFEKLFPGVGHYTEDVNGTAYAYAPRIVNGVNLLEAYCAAVKGTAAPLLSVDAMAFANSEFNDDTWPGATNLWSNDADVVGPFPSASMSWGNTVTSNGEIKVSAASNELYNGYYICYDATGA